MRKQPKITSITLLICVACSTALAQNNVQEQLTLSVERTRDYQTKKLFFKPDKKLKVQTKNGEMLVTSDYSFLIDAIVLNGERITVAERNERHPKYNKKAVSDTISLSEIDWIKGRVFEDGDRKALGGIILALGAASLFIPVGAVLVTGSAAAILLAIPLVPIIIGGYKMAAGTRKFKTSNGWQVHLE